MAFIVGLLGGWRGTIATTACMGLALVLGIMLAVKNIQVANLRVELADCRMESQRVTGELDKCAAVNRAATDTIRRMTADAASAEARATAARAAADADVKRAKARFKDIIKEIESAKASDDAEMSPVLQRAYDRLRAGP